MKLYDVPRGSYVRPLLNQDDESDTNPQNAGKSAEVKVPVGASDVKTRQLIYFDHVDGMYSLCYEVDEETMKHGSSTHMAAWTEVEVVEMESLFSFEQLREKIGRSGYGKDGTGKFREASLSKMNDNWVKASVDFVPANHPHRSLYLREIEYRKEQGIVIEDPEA
jgi:hypothetical protein